MNEQVIDSIARAMKDATDISSRPKTAAMSKETWQMIRALYSASSRIVNVSTKVCPNTYMGLSITFDESIPLGKIEYK
jgi:hypothetical protein